MLKRLKRTWKEEEAQSKKSQSPAPTASDSAAGSPASLPHELLPPTSESEPSVPIAQEADAASSIPPKRNRDTFEPDSTDVAESERPTKLLKTVEVNLDPIRNHLPEIFDFRERYENLAHLSLATLKERIFAQATIENSKPFATVITFNTYPLCPSHCRYSGYKGYVFYCGQCIIGLQCFPASISLLIELISWAIDVEIKRPKSIAARSRTILIVIELVFLKYVLFIV